jgi:uncharacterized membrane protein
LSSWLNPEIDRWVRTGIISADQAERIRALYESPSAPRAGEPRRSRPVVILSVLGALFIAAGIVLFFAHNWTDIPRWGKLLVISGALAGMYAAADKFLFSRRGKSSVVGTSLLLAAGGVYGAAIFLIGQIYNLNSHWPNGLLVWWLGVLPLAYVFDSQALIWLTLVIGQSWFCSELLTYTSEQVGLGLILLLTLLLWTLADAHERLGAALAGPIRAFAAMEGLAVLLLRTWPLWGRYDQRQQHPAAFALLCAAIGVLLAWDIAAKRTRAAAWKFEPRAIAGLTIYAALFIFVPLGSGGWARVAYNAILLAVIAGVLARGIRRAQPWMVNIAVSFIAFEAIARYIDAFWGYLARSAAFLVSGVLLLAGGWLLERQRRFWLRMLHRRGVTP